MREERERGEENGKGRERNDRSEEEYSIIYNKI